jgi:hypothetical protein
MFKKFLSITIIALFLLATMLAATALEVKKEVVFETYDGVNKFQFYNDTIVSETSTDAENLTVNQTILFAIDTGGDFANFKIKFLGFPYKIKEITNLEYFISTNGTTAINPSYPAYYIERPTTTQPSGGSGQVLSVVSKEETKVFDAKGLRVQFLLVFMTVLVGTFILLLERRKRRNRQENTI